MTQTTLIRREKQLDFLWRSFQAIGEKKIQIRFIAGEAGTGKTVIANMFKNEIEASTDDLVTAYGFCNIQSDVCTPYQIFKEILRVILAGVPKQKDDTLNKWLKFSAKVLLETAPDLVGNFIPGGSLIKVIGQKIINESGIIGLLEDREKFKAGDLKETTLFEQYTNALKAISDKYKLVLILDDLQWIDKPSINLLYHLVKMVADYPIMIVGCYRSNDINIVNDGNRHPLSSFMSEIKRNFGNVFIELDEIENTEKEELLDKMINVEQNVYDTDFKKELLKLTDGNPLFVCELINSMKENGEVVKNQEGAWENKNTVDWQAKPAKIEGIIEERIGRLEDSLKEILLHASVQGYRFLAQVLSKTLGEPERNVLVSLSKELQKQHHLISEEGCCRSGKQVISRFQFSNYIFQQYLYHELSESQRLLLHGDIAVILEELYENNLEEVSADLAYHFEMSGEYDKSLKYLYMAGVHAMHFSAYHEAAGIFNKGLELVNQTNDSITTANLRLDILIELGTCIRNTKGWTGPEAREIYRKANELGNKLNELVKICPITFGFWLDNMASNELVTALELAHQYLLLGQKMNNPEIISQAYMAIGNTYYWKGDFIQSQKAFEKCYSIISNFTEEEKKNIIIKYGQDPFPIYLMFKIFILFKMGKFSNSRSALADLIHYSKSLNHPYSLAISLQVATWVEYWFNNFDASMKYADELILLSKKDSFSGYQGIGQLFKGATLVKEGKIEDGLSLINEGYERAGAKVLASTHSILAGKAYYKMGNYRKGIELMEESIAFSMEKGELSELSEQYIVKGKCHQAAKELEEAERAFEKAKSHALSLNACTLELQSTIALAELLAVKGNHVHAARILTEVVSKFGEEENYIELENARIFLQKQEN